MRVVVVGGGIAGASAAYRLALAGAETVLVDREDPGQATAAGAGIVAPGTSRQPDGPWYPLAAAAVRFYPGLLGRLAEDGERETGYRTVGGLFVATSAAEAAALGEVRDRIEARRRAGMPNIGSVSLLEPEEVRSLLPALAPKTRAVHVSEGARVDGRRLRAAMRRAAERHEARLVRGDAALVVAAGRVSAVAVDGREIGCDAVVAAAGAWTESLFEPHGVGLPIVPQRGQIVHLDLPATHTGGWPFVVGFHSHYLLSFPPNRVVAGATREEGSGFDVRLTAAGTREVLSEALRVAPGLGAATVAEWRVGIRPMSPDGLPIIGPVGGVEGLVVAGGLGPSGLTLGPFAGAVAADLALGRSAPPDLDLAPFRPGRFSRAGSRG